MQAGLRADMETRLGADFSGVRVHTDTVAARSAAAVGARAYALGRDIVFGGGQFQPGSSDGRRLLAHELVHVTQQPVIDSPGPVQVGAANSEYESEADRLSASALAASAAAAPAEAAGEVPGEVGPSAVRRAVLRRQPTPQAHQAAPAPALCSTNQRAVIGPGLATAEQWSRKANQSLTEFVDGLSAAPAGPAAGTPAAGGGSGQMSAQARQALIDHFKTDDAATARYVLGVVGQITAWVEALNKSVNAPATAATGPTVGLECHTEAHDTICRTAGAYMEVDQKVMVVCQSFFTGDHAWQAGALVHEIAHSVSTPRGMFITDRGYQQQRRYKDLTRDEALTNAESYELFVQQLGEGRPTRSTAPSDTPHDCPPDWKPLLSKAAEEAQFWNRNALTSINDRDPRAIADRMAEYDIYLDGHGTAQIESAAKAYKKTDDAFKSGIDFECEPKGGGRCDKGAETYWYAIASHLHICPVWRQLQDQDARTEGILAGMYGYKGDVDSAARRRNLAKLAKELTDKYWAVPKTEDVAAALNPRPLFPDEILHPSTPAGQGQKH